VKVHGVLLEKIWAHNHADVCEGEENSSSSSNAISGAGMFPFSTPTFIIVVGP